IKSFYPCDPRYPRSISGMQSRELTTKIAKVTKVMQSVIEAKDLAEKTAPQTASCSSCPSWLGLLPGDLSCIERQAADNGRLRGLHLGLIGLPAGRAFGGTCQQKREEGGGSRSLR